MILKGEHLFVTGGAAGIGEALVTMLNEKGIPTPLVHTMLVAPRSRMDVLTDAEVDTLVAKSKLVKKYAETIDSESAHEIITAKLEEAAEKTKAAEESKAEEKEAAEIEFDFFSSPEPEVVEEQTAEEPAADFFPSETSDLLKNEEPEPIHEEQDSETIEPAVIQDNHFVTEEVTASGTSEFVNKVFEVEREIRNQIGFNSLPSLIGSFGLNERLLYINELFDGSSESFDNLTLFDIYNIAEQQLEISG